MASGLPDYYRGMDVAFQALAELVVRPQNIPEIDVDVLHQTLAQITNRPKYGGAILASGSKAVDANSVTNLCLVSGKGMIYGGAVWLDHTSTQGNGEVQVYADQDTLNDISFYRLSEYGLTKPGSSIVSLNKYDPVDFIYAVGIAYGLTFEVELEINYREVNGTTPTVHYRLVYAVI